MPTIVDLTNDEIAELKKFTSQDDLATAIRTAVVEYIRYCQRLELIELSGRIEIQDDWKEWEQAELETDNGRTGSGSR